MRLNYGERISKAHSLIKSLFPYTLQPAWMRLARALRENRGCLLTDLFYISAIASLVFVLGFFWNALAKLDITTYYYAYSTIAQSLASAFGFLVAVTLYRMESLERDIENAMEEVLEQCAWPDKINLLRRKNRCHDWDDMEKYINEKSFVSNKSDDMKSFISSNWRYFNEGKQKLKDLKAELVQTLFLTSAVIGSSIALIPLSRLLQPEHATSRIGAPFPLLFLVGIFFYACRCLRNYWDIAKRLTEGKPSDHDFTVSPGAFTVGGSTDAQLVIGSPPKSQNDSSSPVQ